MERPLPLLLPALLLLAATPAPAQTTVRVSVDSGGTEGNGSSTSQDLSPDGRWVVFSSYASNLVPGDTNGVEDVFLMDRRTLFVERVSLGSIGNEGNSTNTGGAVSADGRFVAFYAKSDNLVPGDTNFNSDVFVRDRLLGNTVRASVDAAGVQGNAGSYQCAISANGRYVAFESDASNLVPGDTNAATDIFVKDLYTGAIERVSVSSAGVQGLAASRQPAISADGTRVAFMSAAQNLIGVDLNNGPDIFVRDRVAGTTTLVHVDSAGNQGISPPFSAAGPDSPSISADGMRVSYASPADNLVAGDSNAVADVFVHDLANATTTRVSVSSAGVEGDLTSRGSVLAASGRHVMFESRATNLVVGDSNFQSDVFVHDLETGVTERVSVSSAGGEATSTCYLGGLSNDGRLGLFHTDSPVIVPLDFNNAQDAFLRDRGPSPGVITLQGGGLVRVGGTAGFAWSGAPPTGAWALAYSQNVNGTVVFNHPLDLGQPITVAANGPNAPSGSGTWVSGPIPATAAGKQLYFELLARDGASNFSDSCTVLLTLW